MTPLYDAVIFHHIFDRLSIAGRLPPTPASLLQPEHLARATPPPLERCSPLHFALDGRSFYLRFIDGRAGLRLSGHHRISASGFRRSARLAAAYVAR